MSKRQNSWVAKVEQVVSLLRDWLGSSGDTKLREEIARLERVNDDLQTSLTRLRSEFDNASDAIFVHDTAGNLLDVNDSMLSLYRVQRTNYNQFSVVDYAGRSAQVSAIPEIIERVATNGEHVFEWKARRPLEDTEVDVEVALRRMGWGDETVFIGSVRDITRRKEEELKRQRLEERLIQAQKLEAIGRLAGGVAHDFNNLLTVILAYGELLLENLPQDSPMWEQVKEIVEAGVRGQTLTRQLLAFSRKQVFEVQQLELNAVVSGIEKLILRLLGESITVNVRLFSEPLSIRADGTQLEQVLMNLCVNARDAMPSGGTLCIETDIANLDESFSATHLALPPGRYAVLSVSDSGLGMDPTVRQHLFEPFFSTKEKGKGTGLGLSIVHGILRQHGGDILAYSEPGCGSTFKAYLPLSDGVPVLTEQAKAEVVNLGNGQTVLVMDDDPAVRAVLWQMLSELGYSVVRVESPKECLDYVETDQPLDLLLTDVVMPTLNGRALAEQVTARRPSVKVVFMSGYAEDIINQHELLRSGVQFISKPFTKTTLSHKLSHVLGS